MIVTQTSTVYILNVLYNSLFFCPANFSKMTKWIFLKISGYFQSKCVIPKNCSFMSLVKYLTSRRQLLQNFIILRHLSKTNKKLKTKKQQKKLIFSFFIAINLAYKSSFLLEI